MPRAGTLDVKQFGADSAGIQGYKTEPWLLKQAQILNCAIECDNLKTDALLPPAMHPTIPAYALFNVSVYPESPAGPFKIAEVRIVGRAGVRPRGFVLRSYVDGEEACRELARRWGYPALPARVGLELRHDRVIGRVHQGGKLVLECELIDRDAVSGSDIQYVASMHLARNREDGKLILVQVDPDYTFSRAERGKPRVNVLEAAAWKTGGNLQLADPIAASFTLCEVTLPRIRYICDPDRPAFQGTTKVAA